MAQERGEILQQLEDWLEVPMLVLAFVWLLLMLAELIWGLSPVLEALGTAIWVVFIVHFGVEFFVAPRKGAYLKHNWLTAVSLVLPALRIFRIGRVLRLLRGARGLRLLRLVTSVNRGMKTLAGTFRRRGFAYVAGLTVIVVLSGAAGMFAFERDVTEGLDSYGEALWWTAMLLTSIGSEFWPQTAEGRVLCFVLALYGFAVFGYFTATLASFFVGQDAGDEEAELPGAATIERLTGEVAALTAEVRTLRGGDRAP